MRIRHETRLLPIAALLLAASACGAGDGGSNSAVAGTAEDNVAGAAANIPDACTFFAKAELENALGIGLRDGEPQSVAEPNESSCRFRRQLGRDATRTFPNPLPASAGFTSLTISASPADPAAVAEIRELDPGAFEDVPGLGDDAYYLGPALLHVRVGQRGFSIRIEPEASSEGDRAKVREAMIALARAGASRL